MELTSALSKRIVNELDVMIETALSHYSGPDASDDAKDCVTARPLTLDEIDLEGIDDDGLVTVGRLDDYDCTVWLMINPATGDFSEKNLN